MQPIPEISVLMCVYNNSLHVKEAIESILNQTFTNFEFVIVNDGSTDESEAIILSYNDPRIKYLRNPENLGLIASLNKGIEASNGKYIARMDADDISLPERLKEQYAYMESHPLVGVCGSDYYQFDHKTSIHYTALTRHQEILAYMLFNCSVVHPSLIIRKELLNQQAVKFDSSYKHAEDYELWSRLIFQAQFSAVSKTLFKYRLHSGQVTQKHSGVQVDTGNKIRKNILQHAGFSFTEKDLEAHCKIGSSQKLISVQELKEAAEWLKAMLAQSSVLPEFSDNTISEVIGKQWYDTCGNTSLGLKAFFAYYNSGVKHSYKGNAMKLLAKCIIRKFN
jgi:hypothetical protein